MIVTVTPNPALDLTYVLPDRLDHEHEVHRAAAVTIEPSGKGVNVSRALHADGVDGIAVLPVGGPTGRHLADVLVEAGVGARTVSHDGDTRVNTTVLQPGGPTLKINAPGHPLEPSVEQGLVEAITASLAGSAPDDSRWLVICGSLPPGTSPGFVARLVRAAHDAGARCAADTSGEALAQAADAGADLLAPNAAELAEIEPRVGATSGVRALAPVVTRLAAERGCELLISLGARGALWSDGNRTLHGHGPALDPVNSAGAGDALLAGWLSASGDPVDRLQRAVRWGRSACLAPTTVDPRPGRGDPAVPVVDELVTSTA